MASACEEFYDLNIPYPNPNLAAILQRAWELGYSCVALNQIVQQPLSAKHTCTVRPAEVQRTPRLVGRGIVGDSFTQRTRLTVHVDSEAAKLSLSNPAAATYDMLAAVVFDQATFEHCVTTADVDIVSFDPAAKLPVYVSKTLVDIARRRGITFELTYSSALRDASCRRFFVSNAVALLNATGGKGVVFSSEAKDALDLRGPYDVMNLGVLAGLSPVRSRMLVTASADVAVRHGAARLTHKAAVATDAGPLFDRAAAVPAPKGSKRKRTPAAAAPRAAPAAAAAAPAAAAAAAAAAAGESAGEGEDGDGAASDSAHGADWAGFVSL